MCAVPVKSSRESSIITPAPMPISYLPRARLRGGHVSSGPVVFWIRSLCYSVWWFPGCVRVGQSIMRPSYPGRSSATPRPCNVHAGCRCRIILTLTGGVGVALQWYSHLRAAAPPARSLSPLFAVAPRRHPLFSAIIVRPERQSVRDTYGDPLIPTTLPGSWMLHQLRY